jgi:hypothetical protein
MTPTLLHQRLQEEADRPLKIKINDNRSTMLSVRWEPDHTRVSLHKMFLHAPDEVMNPLSQYLQCKKEELNPSIKAFIEQKMLALDYSHLIDASDLITQGEAYDLEAIYIEINETYFDGALNLRITWFGKKGRRYRSRLNLGLYEETTKLIKINRILDTILIPEYVLRFVIYHEMLHNICTAQVDDRGHTRVHTDEFCDMEEQFEHYHLAQKWIRDNIGKLFDGVD